MNRSLEALAILVICLVGILAAVRMSTKDRSSPARAVAQPPDAAPQSDLPDGSGSSAQHSASTELVYDDSCGLDRSTGLIYRPLKPLLSPGAFAASVIRSEPLPLIVLPEAEVVDDTIGYDRAYDEALYGQMAAEELDYRQIEADYAAAELAAAVEAIDEEAFFQSPCNSLTHVVGSIAPWLTQQLNGAGVALVADLKHYDRSYTPVTSAIRSRWAEHVAPHLRLFPRSPVTKKKNVAPAQSITWLDYERFAEREIGPRSEVTTIQRPVEATSAWLRSPAGLLAEACEMAERVLHGAGEQLHRVARQPEDDDIWRSR